MFWQKKIPRFSFLDLDGEKGRGGGGGGGVGAAEWGLAKKLI